MARTEASLRAESLLRDVLGTEAGRARLSVVSNSMTPRILQGDEIEIARVSPRRLMPGDVLVFRSEAAGLVVHRLIWREPPLGEPLRIITKGDALDRLDRAAEAKTVLGRVVCIRRGGGSVRPTTLTDRLRCLRQAAGYGLRRWARRRLTREQR